jgi:hypothetical protein
LSEKLKLITRNLQNGKIKKNILRELRACGVVVYLTLESQAMNVQPIPKRVK